MGPFWVRTLVLKSGLSPKSGLFKKTDFPPSLILRYFVCILKVTLFNFILSFLIISDQVSPTSVLLIGNAVYFKDAWQLVFEEGKKCIEFTNTDGRTIKTKMMTRDSKKQIVTQFTSSLVGDNTKFLAISIPYKVELWTFT